MVKHMIHPQHGQMHVQQGDLPMFLAAGWTEYVRPAAPIPEPEPEPVQVKRRGRPPKVTA